MTVSGDALPPDFFEIIGHVFLAVFPGNDRVQIGGL
jgi:hypothetical protein